VPHLLFLGLLDAAAVQLAASLLQANHTITFSLEPTAADLVIAVLNKRAELESWRLSARPWLAWNRTEDSALTAAAYQAGALAVLPAELSPATFSQTITNTLSLLNQPKAPATPRTERTYQRADPLILDHNAVVEVLSGIVALRAVHYDGAEVLLGLCGPGHTLVYHPADSCNLQLAAHTDARVRLWPWEQALREPNFAEQLRARLQQMEAWAAIQARPYLDQRVLGLLSLLAEQFGEPHPEGTLVNVRLTHAQLASAASATRTTITRTLGDLKTRGHLLTLGSGEAERFIIRQRETGAHQH
jgi:CRP-like cAMP-binding protein